MIGVHETYSLLNPQAAPLELLGGASVGPTGTYLASESKAGPISLELYGRSEAYNDTQEDLVKFHEPEGSNVASIADEKACPYVVLPPESFYTVQLYAPESMLNQPWSSEYEQPLVGVHENRFMELDAFQKWFPSVKTDLPSGKYEIFMSVQARPMLAVLIRNSLYGPLSRRQPDIEKSHYEETFSGVFKPSLDRPNTMCTTYDAYETRIDGRDQALCEPLYYDPSSEDGYGQTVEIVIVEATQIKGSEISFHAPQEHGRGSLLRRYEAHEEGGLRPLPIAAFKFALRSA